MKEKNTDLRWSKRGGPLWATHIKKKNCFNELLKGGVFKSPRGGLFTVETNLGVIVII